MKKAIALCLLCLASVGVGAEEVSFLSEAPPDPAAAALLDEYLPLLASGDFPRALALNDLRGMRQYLLERRLEDVQRRQPGLEQEKVNEISASIQLNDLAPSRLEAVFLDMMSHAGYAGMTWTVRGYAPAPEPMQGYVAFVDTLRADGRSGKLLLGLKMLGAQWFIAPEIVEEVTARQLAARATGSMPEIPPPDAVTTAIGAFWGDLKNGDAEAAYGRLGADARRQLPLLAFLEQVNVLVKRIGVPSGWTITHCRRLEQPGQDVRRLGLGLNIQGASGATPAIMVFHLEGQTWVLDVAQFQAPQLSFRPRYGSPAVPAEAAQKSGTLSPTDWKATSTLTSSATPLEGESFLPVESGPARPAMPDAPDAPLPGGVPTP